jgi:hypothetical protein
MSLTRPIRCALTLTAIMASPKGSYIFDVRRRWNPNSDYGVVVAKRHQFAAGRRHRQSCTSFLHLLGHFAFFLSSGNRRRDFTLGVLPPERQGIPIGTVQDPSRKEGYKETIRVSCPSRRRREAWERLKIGPFVCLMMKCIRRFGRRCEYSGITLCVWGAIGLFSYALSRLSTLLLVMLCSLEILRLGGRTPASTLVVIPFSTGTQTTGVLRLGFFQLGRSPRGRLLVPTLLLARLSNADKGHQQHNCEPPSIFAYPSYVWFAWSLASSCGTRLACVLVSS